MNTLPKFKLHPAFKRTERSTGLAAVTNNNTLRPYEISIRGVAVGSVWNTHHHHSGSDTHGGDSRWKTTIYTRGARPNVTFKFENPDVEIVKGWVRENVNLIWQNYLSPEDVKKILDGVKD